MAELRLEAKSNVLLAFIAALFLSVSNFLFFCLVKPEYFLAVHGQRHFRPHESFMNKAYALGAPIGGNDVFRVGIGGRNFFVTLIIAFYLHVAIGQPALGLLRTFLGLGAGIELMGCPIGGAFILQAILVGLKW